MEPRAVLHLSNELGRIAADAYLDVWRLRPGMKINDLWKESGKRMVDIYAIGEISNFSYRQLRAHWFLFISHRKHVVLSDRTIKADVYIQHYQNMSAKELETKIGETRRKLRRNFGNSLRRFALENAIFLNGSEVETLNMADPRRHTVCGLPEEPAHYFNDVTWKRWEDGGTDEKLVSLLDYMTYSCDEVYYVGCGDLRTLGEFSRRDSKRFTRVTWKVFDILPTVFHAQNVQHYKQFINTADDLRNFLSLEADNLRKERLFIWDVAGERTERWEEKRYLEDRTGEKIALTLKNYFSLAVIKHRIPEEMESYKCIFSMLVPQPSAPSTMYELRSILRLDGYTWINREHIEAPIERTVASERCRRMVHLYHGEGKGRMLKRTLFQYLHIERVDGTSDTRTPRADLFYLTNTGNDFESVERVVNESQISTLWVGRTDPIVYGDNALHRSYVSLRFSSYERRVLDGNSALLFFLWKRVVPIELNYDPVWAAKFAVIFRFPVPDAPVPDLSLCSFIGLKYYSSSLRISVVEAHESSDLVKIMGLDLSGHLMVALISDSYVSDMCWWFNMILDWSVLSADQKRETIKKEGAELVEWKDDRADMPWHVRADLIAALEHLRTMKHLRYRLPVNPWLERLRR
uniref:Core protein VP4 n=1 Tax=Ife virus TaxID=2547357 RepID=A0A482A8Q7_9REOV|nr:VP4 [Ife virus]